MPSDASLTHGPVFQTLNRFTLPILLALVLQALYGAVDMWVVGRYSSTADVSGVATAGLLMVLLTDMASSLATGLTIVIGQYTGAGEKRKACQAIGAGLCLFGIITALVMALLLLLSDQLATWLLAPPEAHLPTQRYLFVCGTGLLFINAYNLLAAIFRGLGDSRTPLISVAIACVCNIVGDMILVAHFNLGAVGAAIATVLSQGVSVLLSLLIIVKRKDLQDLHGSDLRLNAFARQIFRLGFPLALQDVMVSLSFLTIQIVVNSINVVSSAAIGIGEKLSLFIMLIPLSYMQSLSAFVAQNIGAKREDRAISSLYCGMATSFLFGIAMALFIFFHADWLCGIFTQDPLVIRAGMDYLYAYGIDCLQTPFLFCFFGFFTGRGNTLFVMLQGIFGAFFLRIPVALFTRKCGITSLFTISLGTPLSTCVQLVIFIFVFLFILRSRRSSSRLQPLHA